MEESFHSYFCISSSRCHILVSDGSPSLMTVHSYATLTLNTKHPPSEDFPFRSDRASSRLRTLERERDGAARLLAWLLCVPPSRNVPPQLTLWPCHVLFSPPLNNYNPQRAKAEQLKQRYASPRMTNCREEKCTYPPLCSYLFYFVQSVYYYSCACTEWHPPSLLFCGDKWETLQPLRWRVFGDGDTRRSDVKRAIYSQVELIITHS